MPSPPLPVLRSLRREAGDETVGCDEGDGADRIADGAGDQGQAGFGFGQVGDSPFDGRYRESVGGDQGPDPQVHAGQAGDFACGHEEVDAVGKEVADVVDDGRDGTGGDGGHCGCGAGRCRPGTSQVV